MSGYNTERIAELLGLLKPAPAAWVEAAQELPFSRLDETESEETLALLDEALTVHEALAASPEHCREILDRFFARDESYKTIGAALDLPPGTIASRISRCLARLRELLEGRTDPGPTSGEQ